MKILQKLHLDQRNAAQQNFVRYIREARRFFSLEKQVFLAGFSLTSRRFPLKSKNRLNTSLPKFRLSFINQIPSRLIKFFDLKIKLFINGLLIAKRKMCFVLTYYKQKETIEQNRKDSERIQNKSRFQQVYFYTLTEY